MKKDKKKKLTPVWQIWFAFLDTLVNLWYSFLFNTHIMIYNYFGGLIVMFI